MAGCVIRLWPDEAVELGLVLGEGVETTLAAATLIRHRCTLLQPAWAACSAGSMESFPVLAGIEALTLLVDNDANGRGQEAAAICCARWTAAGREVVRLTPKKPGNDFNDLVYP
jgi:putative DNA primase/helicase